MNQFTSGAQFDIRPESEKNKDYKFGELVASVNAVEWKEKIPDQWRKFPIFNQDGSGSCVAQTEAKEMGIMRWLKDKVYIHFSATDIYQRRTNKPGSGMGAVDARNIVKNGGAVLEALSPSQSLTDQQMDEVIVESYKREVGDIFKVPNYVELPIKDIETVASFIQTTGKGAMVWFYFNNNGEWIEHPIVKDPNLDLSAFATNRHSVTAVDFALINGKKCLIIEDSWGGNAGIGGQRVIDEDFYKARNWYAGYLMNFRFDTQTQPIPVPKYTFLQDLEFGMQNSDIKVLQDILKFEQLFPSNASSTGYFGAVTKTSVGKFQLKYKLITSDNIGYGRVGPITRAKLNSLYG
ncbi:hypothetical protein HY967_01615 [Candidatus Jorgensenbacteria bacterium]|nr:hypothetical protein [Candidatus Jorgensenbacteria bacterium]